MRSLDIEILMKKLPNIAFYISDKRHFDYFRNLLLALCEMGNEPVLILNDTRGLYGGKALPVGYVDEMKELAGESGFTYVISSESLRKKERFKLIVSTFAYYYKIPFGAVRLKSLLFYYLSTAILKIPLLKAVLHRFTGIQKRITASAAQITPGRNWVWPEQMHANQSVFFPKGLDISEQSPDKAIRELPDLFFCHGPYDQAIIQKNTGKPVIPIGYPRYDGLSRNREEERSRIVEEFGLNPEQPLVTWLPTFAKHGRNISEWLEQFRKLSDTVNVILRPHPKLMDEQSRDFYSHLETSGAVLDHVAQRNMTDLYGASDFVCCDYGGTIFSALYTKTPLLLLDLSDHKTIAVTRNRSSDIRVRETLFHLTAEEAEERGGLQTLLNDQVFWEAQKVVQKNVRDLYFGKISIGESSHVAAKQLIKWAGSI
ncbi:MAG: hypothetical protein EA360_11250 [Balneolaceae bacterium]|nr:MAG: hypothetical protein EA360_11250 [Balneolaceae bacterium]